MGGRGVNKIGTSEFQYDFKKKEGLFCEFQRKFCTFFNKVTLLLDSVLTVHLCEHGVLLTDCLLFTSLPAFGRQARRLRRGPFGPAPTARLRRWPFGPAPQAGWPFGPATQAGAQAHVPWNPFGDFFHIQ